MSVGPVCVSRWVLSLCLILAVVLAAQGAPTAGRRNIPKSGANPAIEDSNQLKEWAGGVKIPLLPPDEELGSAVEGVKDGDDGVSGEDHISGSGINMISGDDSIDYTDFHFPVRIKKSELQEDDGQGGVE